MKSKKCIKCQKIRLIKFFNKRKVSKDGFRNSCKSCEAKRCREYYFCNKETIIGWKKKNQTKIQKYQQDYYPKYREKNREKIIKYKKQYQTKNRNIINAKINKK